MSVFEYIPHIATVTLICWQSCKISTLEASNNSLTELNEENIEKIKRLSSAIEQNDKGDNTQNACSVGWEAEVPCKVTSVIDNKFMCTMYPDGNLHKCEVTTNIGLEDQLSVGSYEYISGESPDKKFRLPNGHLAGVIDIQDKTAEIAEKLVEEKRIKELAKQQKLEALMLAKAKQERLNIEQERLEGNILTWCKNTSLSTAVLKERLNNDIVITSSNNQDYYCHLQIPVGISSFAKSQMHLSNGVFYSRDWGESLGWRLNPRRVWIAKKK